MGILKFWAMFIEPTGPSLPFGLALLTYQTGTLRRVSPQVPRSGGSMNMAIYYIVLLALSLGLQTNSQANPTNAQGNSPKPTVSLKDISGDVRVKLKGGLVWIPASKDQMLGPGEKVYTSDKSTVLIQYLESKVVLKMTPFSLMRIADRPPLMSQFARSFGVEKRKGDSLVIPENGVRILARPDDWGEEQNSEAKSGPSGPGLVDQYVRPVRVEYPNAQTFAGAAKFPLRIPFKVDPNFASVNLWAYVWKRGKGSTPVSKVFSKGNFSGVTFSSEGEYVVQLVCEDESCASGPIKVQVLKGSAADLIDRIGNEGLDGKATVILP